MSYKWEKQSISAECAAVECPAYDPIKDFARDPSGYYVLIRVEREDRLIEVALCNKDHAIEMIFRGSAAQDIYYAVFQEEKKREATWFSNKEHIAYLGKELNKAQAALAEGAEYWQE